MHFLPDIAAVIRWLQQKLFSLQYLLWHSLMDLQVQHFVCRECLDVHVSTETQSEMRRREQREGKIFCPSHPLECNACAYPDVALAQQLSSATFANYQSARLQLLEKKMTAELESEMQKRLDAELRRLAQLDEEERKVMRACRDINENILTCRCPRCGQAFIDFEGCFALHCSRCPCGFCGWCFTDCGNDAHAHLRESCRAKPEHAAKIALNSKSKAEIDGLPIF